MRTPKVLRTQAFRIVAIYLAIFAISAIALAGFVYWNTALVLDRETDQTIEAEITGLVEQYQRLGLPGLNDAITGRAVRGDQAARVPGEIAEQRRREQREQKEIDQRQTERRRSDQLTECRHGSCIPRREWCEATAARSLCRSWNAAVKYARR